MTDIDRIISFFLHIFRLQSCVSEEVEGSGEYHLIPSDSKSARIYELRVKLFSGWKTRRISIRQIGEALKSKSTCYVVTYDDLLVLKIPPLPLSNFDSYLENINIERTISKQLSPSVYCVSPTLSSILNKIPELAGKIPRNAKDVDEEYIGLLTKEPRYQGYLKIGDRFAFFMSLSKHPFFDQVIEKIHGDKQWIHDEMVKTSRLFQNLDAFESVYGSDSMDLYFGINALCKDVGRKIDHLLASYETISSIPEYQKQEWMSTTLSGTQLEFNKNELPVKFCDDVGQLLSSAINEQNKWVDQYRKSTLSRIRKKNFDKNRTRIEVLIIKTLELMYHLKKRGVAARDLKPDNILVMGAGGEEISQLADPGTYKLGLIDLETAVNFSHKDEQQIKQPMLAGTPAFMTPSHVFENHILTEAFGKEISRIFYMQDWFSAICMIYAMATGGWLFQKTARLIPEIMRAQKKGAEKKTSVSETFSTVSRIFWRSAEDELSEKILRDQPILQNIHLTLPEHIIELFEVELEKEHKLLRDMIAYCARSQKFFPNKAQKFIDATYEEIRGQRMKLEGCGNDLQTPPDIRQKLVKLFELLENMKLKQRDYPRLEEQINHPMTCDELLNFLFQRVLHTMYRITFFKGCEEK